MIFALSACNSDTSTQDQDTSDSTSTAEEEVTTDLDEEIQDEVRRRLGL